MCPTHSRGTSHTLAVPYMYLGWICRSTFTLADEEYNIEGDYKDSFLVPKVQASLDKLLLSLFPDTTPLQSCYFFNTFGNL